MAGHPISRPVLVLLLVACAAATSVQHVQAPLPRGELELAPTEGATLGTTRFMGMLTSGTDLLVAISPCTTAPVQDYCLGVYAGTMDTAGRVACLGSPTACRQSGDPELYACAAVLAERSLRGGGVAATRISPADDVSFRYYVAASGGGAACVDIDTSPLSAADACPVFDVITRHTTVTGAKAMAVSIQRSPTPRTPAITSQYAVASVVLHTSTRDHAEIVAGAALAGHGAMLSVVSHDGQGLVCYWQTPLSTAGPPMWSSTGLLMYHPTKRLVVGTPALMPTVRDDDGEEVPMLTNVAVYLQGRAIDSVFIGTGYEPRSLALEGCMKMYTVVTTFLTSAGSVIYAQNQTFCPMEACAADGRALDCFCERACSMGGDSNRDNRFGMADPDCVDVPVVSEAARRRRREPHPAVVHALSVIPPNTGHAASVGVVRSTLTMPADLLTPAEQAVRGCAVFHIDTASVIQGHAAAASARGPDSVAMVCTAAVPAGRFALYHGMVRPKDAVMGHVGEYGVAYTDLHMCSIGPPSIEATLDEAGAGVAYLYAHSGLTCPTAAVPTHAPTPVIEWRYSIRGREQTSLLPMTGDFYWYPPTGFYIADVHWPTLGDAPTFETPPIFVDAQHVMPPPAACTIAGAAVTVNHVPIFHTDKEARATVMVDYVLRQNPAGTASRVWAISTVRNGVPGAWYEYARTSVDTERPPPHVVSLEAGVDYNFRIMLMTELPHATNVFSGDICFIETTHIAAMPPVRIQVLVPIHPVACDDTILIFTVASNVPLPLPSSGYDIDLLSGPEGDLLHYTYALGPNPLDAPSREALLLLFDFGTDGVVTVPDLADMVMAGAYPRTGWFEVSQDTITLAHAEDATSAAALEEVDSVTESRSYHCGPQLHTVSVGVRHNTPLPYTVTVGDVVEEVRPTAPGVHVTRVGGIMSPAITAVEPLTVTITLGVVRGFVIDSACPARTFHYSLAPYLPVDVGVSIVDIAPADAEAVCGGKRRFVFHVPRATQGLMRYTTQEDPDLGTIDIMPDSIHALTVGRTAPLVMHVFYRGTTAQPWQATNCESAVAADAFAGYWVPPSATIDVEAIALPQCGAGNDARARLVVAVPDEHEVTLRGRDGTYYYSGYPQPPRDGLFVYENLPLGVYTGQAARYHTDPGAGALVRCAARRVVPLGHSYDESDLLAETGNTLGVHQMGCPREVYGVWREYQRLQFAPGFSDTHDVEDVLYTAWNTANMTTGKGFVYEEDGAVRGSYLLPNPGTFVAEIALRNAEGAHECTYYLPEYTVSEPVYTTESFILQTARYPTCLDSSDGVVRVLFPAAVVPEFLITRCTRWGADHDEPNCIRGLATSTPEPGVIEITGLPFTSVLIIQFDVMATCRFAREFDFAPPLFMYPEVSELRYVPSCQPVHAIEPVYVAPDDTRHALATSAGTTFAWVVTDRASGGSTAHTSHTVHIDPEAADGYDVAVDISYANGRCHSRASHTFAPGALFVPPVVKIDPLVASAKGSRSLPVFCPGASDAQLFARLSPPATGESTVVWAAATTGAAVDVAQVVRPRPDMSLVHSLAADTYTVTYIYVSAAHDLVCTATDTMVVPPKTEYNVVTHMHIQPAECTGGSASATLVDDDDCPFAPEFVAFTADMVAPADRPYIKDNGHGSRTVTGVPNGHVMEVAIAYPDTYKYRPARSCPDKMRISFARTAPLPVVASTGQIACSAAEVPVALHVPHWYARTEVQWQDRDIEFLEATHGAAAMLDMSVARKYKALVSSPDHPECVQQSTLAVGPHTNSLVLTAVPAAQTLKCPYHSPVPVRIYARRSGLVAPVLVDTLPPAVLQAVPHTVDPETGVTTYTYTLSAVGMDGGCPIGTESVNFTVQTGGAPTITGVTVPDLVCSGKATMDVVLSLDMGGLVLDADHMTAHADARCETAGDAMVKCSVPRREAVDIHVAFGPDDAPHACAIDFSTVHQVDLARDNTFDAATLGLDIGALPAGVHRIVAGDDSGCPVDAVVAVPSALLGGADVVDTETPVVVMQIVQPSCVGAEDGMVVLSHADLSHSAIVMRARGDTTCGQQSCVGEVHAEEAGANLVVTGLSTGTYWAMGDPAVMRTYVTMIEIPEPPPLAVYMQPSALPPPTAVTDATVLAIPASATGPVPVSVYVRGATTKTAVVVTGVRVGATSVGDAHTSVRCPLQYAQSALWPHVCRTSLAPGYRYTVNTECGDSDEAHARRRRRTETGEAEVTIDNEFQMTLQCSVTRQPMSLDGTDGEVQMSVTHGIGPFIYTWADRDTSTQTTSRHMSRTGVGSGTYILYVQDIGATLDTETIRACEVTLAPVVALAMTRAEVQHTTGCGSATRATVRITSVSPSTPLTKVGAWNEGIGEAVIAACADGRMYAVGTPELVLGVGRWRIAACSGGTLTAPASATVVVSEVGDDMGATAVHGELCVSPLDAGAVYTKVPMAVELTRAVPPFVVRTPTGDLDTTYEVETRDGSAVPVFVVTLPPLPPGMHTFDVADARECFREVHIENRDTGPAPCGTCSMGDRSCYGCDGVANSGVATDRCGVCGGNNACLASCAIETKCDAVPAQNRVWQIADCDRQRRPVRVAWPPCLQSIPAVESDASFRGNPNTPLTGLRMAGDNLAFEAFHVAGPAHLTADSVLFDDSTLTGNITFRRKHCGAPLNIDIRASRLRGVRLNVDAECDPAPPLQQRGRRLMATDDSETGTNVTITIIDSEGDETIIFGQGIEVVVENSTIEVIVLVGEQGDILLIETGSNIRTLDITGYLLANGTKTDTICTLFAELPDLRSIRIGGDKFLRKTLDCREYGVEGLNTSFDFTNILAGAGAAIGLLILSVLALGWFRVGRQPSSDAPEDVGI